MYPELLRRKSEDLFELFYVFSKVGLFTVGGGGYAMLPLLEREVVKKRGWLTEEELLDYYAIGQSTPGIIAVNTATFTGCKRCGIPGAIAATFGMVFPSLIIISVIAACFTNFAENEYLQNAFAGIRIAVPVILFPAISKLAKKAIKGKLGITICLIAFLLIAFHLASPATVVLGAILLGILKHILSGEDK